MLTVADLNVWRQWPTPSGIASTCAVVHPDARMDQAGQAEDCVARLVIFFTIKVGWGIAAWFNSCLPGTPVGGRGSWLSYSCYTLPLYPAELVPNFRLLGLARIILLNTYLSKVEKNKLKIILVNIFV